MTCHIQIASQVLHCYINNLYSNSNITFKHQKLFQITIPWFNLAIPWFNLSITQFYITYLHMISWSHSYINISTLHITNSLIQFHYFTVNLTRQKITFFTKQMCSNSRIRPFSGFTTKSTLETPTSSCSSKLLQFRHILPQWRLVWWSLSFIFLFLRSHDDDRWTIMEERFAIWWMVNWWSTDRRRQDVVTLTWEWDLTIFGLWDRLIHQFRAH